MPRARSRPWAFICGDAVGAVGWREPCGKGLASRPGGTPLPSLAGPQQDVVWSGPGWVGRGEPVHPAGSRGWGEAHRPLGENRGFWKTQCLDLSPALSLPSVRHWTTHQELKTRRENREALRPLLPSSCKELKKHRGPFLKTLLLGLSPMSFNPCSKRKRCIMESPFHS